MKTLHGETNNRHYARTLVAASSAVRTALARTGSLWPLRAGAAKAPSFLTRPDWRRRAPSD
jgi:hypothetical protein